MLVMATMNFDTRTVLDILYLDDEFAKELESMVLEEHKLWIKAGKNSNNDFVKSIAPLIQDSIRMRMVQSLKSLELSHLLTYIDYINVDYFQLIPAIAKI